jgi:hypothetical protein
MFDPAGKVPSWESGAERMDPPDPVDGKPIGACRP